MFGFKMFAVTQIFKFHIGAKNIFLGFTHNMACKQIQEIMSDVVRQFPEPDKAL